MKESLNNLSLRGSIPNKAEAISVLRLLRPFLRKGRLKESLLVLTPVSPLASGLRPANRTPCQPHGARRPSGRPPLDQLAVPDDRAANRRLTNRRRPIGLLAMTLSFVSILFLPSFLFAKEEAPSAVMAVKPLREESSLVARPFEFLITKGEWANAKAGKIFTTGTHAPDFVLPSLKEMPAPLRYPRWAVREGWEGEFVIAIEVLKTGEVGRWKVTKSTGYTLLDEAATQAVRSWKFHPAAEKGQTIISCIQIPIQFKLKD